MKKKLISFLLLGVTFSLASCGNTPAATTSSDVPEAKEYYLTGDMNLGDATKLQFNKDGDTYTLSNVTLRRGNSFQISEKHGALDFNHLSSALGFKEGKNGYIRVMNEGIYNISINADENISLTKTGSSYSKVQLHVGEDKTFDFTMNDNFTYQLNNVALPYRENFYITLDDERLSFNDFDYNDLYYSALRFNENKVQVVQKGDFNFALNFANENALVVTSENLKLPQELPSDPDSYVNLVNSLNNQFSQEASKFTLTETTYLAEDQSTSNIYYEEGISLNERYYTEKHGDDEDAYESIRANILTETNYYEITRYENSTSTPSLNGYLIGEQPADNNDTDSTIVKLDKNYLTLEKAKDRMLTLVGKDSFVKSNLLSPTKVLHLASNEHSSSYDTAYYADAKITAKYAGSVGDGMEIKATNTEKHSTSTTHKAVTNEIEFTTDNLSHLTKGKYVLSYYEGNDIFDDKEELLSTASPYKTITYTFTYEYETREESTSFHIDLSKYLLDEVYLGSSITIKAGDTINNASLPIADYEPLDAIDKSKLQIVEFDSEYLTQGKGDKTTFTANKKGETSVKVGTLYSNKTYNLDVHIDYKDPSSISVSPSVSSSTEFYVGTTYNFTATVSTSYADPAVSVETSDSSKVQITIDDIETQRINGKANFSLKMLEACDTSITVTIKSVSKPSVISKITINKILPALTIADFAGTYYHFRDNKTWTITIADDGQSNLSNDQGVSYNFKAKTQGATVVLDSSDTVASFSATISVYNTTAVFHCLEISEFTLKDGTDVKANIYSYSSLKFYEVWSNFYNYDNMVDSENGATIEFVELSLSTYSSPSVNYKITMGDVTYTFTWSSSSYGTGSIKDVKASNSSSSGYGSLSNVTENSFTLRLYAYGSSPFDITFNFSPAE